MIEQALAVPVGTVRATLVRVGLPSVDSDSTVHCCHTATPCVCRRAGRRLAERHLAVRRLVCLAAVRRKHPPKLILKLDLARRTRS